MTEAIPGAPKLGDPASRAVRGFVVNHDDGFEGTLQVRTQPASLREPQGRRKQHSHANSRTQRDPNGNGLGPRAVARIAMGD